MLRFLMMLAALIGMLMGFVMIFVLAKDGIQAALGGAAFFSSFALGLLSTREEFQC